MEERIGFGFYQSCKNKRSASCLGCGGAGGVGGEWVGDWTRVWRGGIMSV